MKIEQQINSAATVNSSAEKTGQFEALDGLRGCAAIAVCVFHFNGYIIKHGYLAVDFFLVLSGFILSHSYLYNNRTTVVEFINNRIARLYPLHIYTLFTFILAYVFVNQALPSYPDGTIFTFLQNLTLTHNVGLNGKGLTYNYPSWSISVEFFVNVIFVLMISKTTKANLLLLFSLSGLLLIFLKSGHLDVHHVNYFGFLNGGVVRGLSSFFLGVLSYRIYLKLRINKSIGVRGNFYESILILLLVVLLFGPQDKFNVLLVFSPVLFMIIVSLFALEHGYVSLYMRKIRDLGVISYSIYLNQITVLLVVRYFGDSLNLPLIVQLVVYLCLLLAYSAVTYEFIEKPLRKKGRVVLNKLWQPRTG